jgi:hypothetical protein
VNIAFVFPGQGAQVVGMGRDLYETSPGARAIFDQADATLRFPLTRLCFEGPKEELTATENAQPALLITSIALLAALAENDVECVERNVRRTSFAVRCASFVAGHSLGEYTAMVAAGALDVPTALRLAEALAPVAPTWLEDPVPPDPRVLAAVAASSPVPIATGENTYLVEGFAELIDHAAAHILTPDVQKAGGLLEATRIADLAARRFLPVAPHCIASPLGFLAAVHVCAAATNAICLEFHATDVPFWEELLVTDGPVIADGSAAVPTAPGLGGELDLDVVRRYAAPGEPVFGAPPVR